MSSNRYRRAAIDDDDWELPRSPNGRTTEVEAPSDGAGSGGPNGRTTEAEAPSDGAGSGGCLRGCLQECWGCLLLLSLAVGAVLTIRGVGAEAAERGAWLPPTPPPTPSPSPSPPPPSLLLLALQQQPSSLHQRELPPTPTPPPPSPRVADLGACPWLAGGLSLRDEDPPRWCPGLTGQRQLCERAHVRTGPGLFRWCAYVDDDHGGRCVSVPEEERCDAAPDGGHDGETQSGHGDGGDGGDGGERGSKGPPASAEKKATKAATAPGAGATADAADVPSAARQPPWPPASPPQQLLQPSAYYNASATRPRYPKASDKCGGRTGVTEAEVEFASGPVMNVTGPTRLHFYVYRAQDAAFLHSPPHLESANVANLPGVLLYLHYEAGLGGCPRKFGITRVMRFNLTTFATRRAFDTWPDERRKHAYGHQFAPFVAYDFGQARDAQRLPGFPTVGCASARHLQAFYYNPFLKSRGHAYSGAAFYSLPGSCSSQPHGKKTDACRRADPGGECPPGVVPDGVRCTWSAQPLGEVSLDELSERPRGHAPPAGAGGAETTAAEEQETYEAFCARGGFEWKEECDCGGPCVARGSTAEECSRQHSCFWDGRMDARRNAERVAELNRRFVAKYPGVPGDVRAPICQWQ